MRLRELGEFALIEKILRASPTGRGVYLGIGDDAAWVKSKTGLLLTSDLLIDKVHFDRRWASFYEIGYKSLAVNLSDIAAMGGLPDYLVLSLGVPVDFRVEDIEEFYRGIAELASRSGVSLVGGDLSASQRFFISAFVVGHASRHAVKRSGARPGDDLYVTGTLGDSSLGLHFLKNPKKLKGVRGGSALAYLRARHFLPSPRLKAGVVLSKERLARAMIDVSDGLLQDLGHLCQASGIGAVIWQEALPLSPAYRLLTRRDQYRWALAGGEDYELLFSIRSRDRRRLERIQSRLGVPVSHIGRCVPARQGIKVTGIHGTPISLSRLGYDHFKGRGPSRARKKPRSYEL